MENVMDSMDRLMLQLKKIERYNSLFYTTAKVMIVILLVTAIDLLVQILVLMNDFYTTNYQLGTLIISGDALSGTVTNVLVITTLAAAVAIFLVAQFLRKKLIKAQPIQINSMDRSKSRDEIVGEIVNIDWKEIRKDLGSAKLSFITNNAVLVGVFAFLYYFILEFIYLLVFPYPYSPMNSIQYLIIGLAIIISVVILRKNLRKNVADFRELSETLKQLRRFLDEFEKSGLPT